MHNLAKSMICTIIKNRKAAIKEAEVAKGVGRRQYFGDNNF